MESKYSVPEEIRKFKPKGTMIKKLQNKYYVYEKKDVYDKIKKRSKTVIGNCVGRITLDDGYVLNNVNLSDEEIVNKDYGEFNFVVNNTHSLLKQLMDVIDIDTAERLYIIAIICYVDEFPALSSYKQRYDYSFLSNKYKDIHLSKNTISDFIGEIGAKFDFIERFYNNMIKSSSKKIAFDGHCVKSYSYSNDLTEYGNKYQETGVEQYNIVIGYDVENLVPVYSKAFRGGELDKTSIQEILMNENFKNLLLIMDNGFFSQKNLELFKKNNQYIIPLSSNLNDYKNATKDLNFTSAFSYDAGKEQRLIKTKTILLNANTNEYIFVCKDITLATKLEAEYIHNIEIGTKGHTLEEFEKIKDMLAVVVLMTNYSEVAAKVYVTYKKRWGVEIFNNLLKNHLGFNAMGIQSYNQTQGFSFIIVLTGIIDNLLKKAIKNTNDKKIMKLSVQEVIKSARILKLIRHYKEWDLTNITLSNISKFTKLGIDVKYALNDK